MAAMKFHYDHHLYKSAVLQRAGGGGGGCAGEGGTEAALIGSKQRPVKFSPRACFTKPPCASQSFKMGGENNDLIIPDSSLSVSLCISFPLSLSASVSLSLCLAHSVSVSVSLYLSLFTSVSISLTHTLSLSSSLLHRDFYHTQQGPVLRFAIGGR